MPRKSPQSHRRAQRGTPPASRNGGQRSFERSRGRPGAKQHVERRRHGAEPIAETRGRNVRGSTNKLAADYPSYSTGIVDEWDKLLARDALRLAQTTVWTVRLLLGTFIIALVLLK